MHRSQHGFALVEAVLAVVLLGIVGVTILGQFGEPLDDVAAIHRGVDSKTSSAVAINYSARILDPVSLVAVEAHNDCANRGLDADFPSDFVDPGWLAGESVTTCR